MKSWLLRGAAELHRGVLGLRRLFYSKRVYLSTPVVSVGNLTVGGTGKTPVIQLLLEHLKLRGHRPAVVSRNYKADIKGTEVIDLQRPQAAFYYGDEPTLIAKNFPNIPVCVGPSKWFSAQEVERLRHPDVILIDDGFQHQTLHRDLDIVLLDVTVPDFQYRLLPEGRAREPWSALQRADWIFLTKVNLVEPGRVMEMRRRLPERVKVVEISYRLGNVRSEEKNCSVVAFAGLARPESFLQSLKCEGVYRVCEFVPFPDHHVYRPNEIEKLFRLLEKHAADFLLTTEKDWIKLESWVREKEIFRILQLKPFMENGAQEFYADLEKIISGVDQQKS